MLALLSATARISSGTDGRRLANALHSSDSLVVHLGFFMAALRSRCGHYIFALWFPLFLFSFLIYLSSRRVHVYHSSIHAVALVRI